MARLTNAEREEIRKLHLRNEELYDQELIDFFEYTRNSDFFINKLRGSMFHNDTHAIIKELASLNSNVDFLEKLRLLQFGAN